MRAASLQCTTSLTMIVQTCPSDVLRKLNMAIYHQDCRWSFFAHRSRVGITNHCLWTYIFNNTQTHTTNSNFAPQLESFLFTPSLGRVRRLCRGLEKFFPPVLQRCYGCSFDAQEIVHTSHGMLGFFFHFFFWRERCLPKVS